MKTSDPLNLIPIKIDTVGIIVKISRINFDSVSPAAEASPVEDGIVPFVLQFDKAPEQRIYIDSVAAVIFR